MKKISLSIISVIFIFISCKKEVTINNTHHIIPNKITKTSIKRIPIDTISLKSITNDSIIAFYNSFHNTIVWISNKNRETFIKILKNCEQEGLLPKDYNIEKIEAFENHINSLSNTESISYDLLLTNSFYQYTSDLTTGKLIPKELYRDWDLEKQKPDISKILTEALNNKSIKETIEQIEPQHIVYKNLKKGLEIINTLPDDTIKKIKLNVTKIAPNDTNICIISIKKKLIYWKDLKPINEITPIYDDNTYIAIKHFQKRHGLETNGIINDETVKALNVSKEERKKQIIVNLERWRWYPKNMGEEYIIINIPNYMLYFIKKEDTISINRVIVGKPKRKSPILSSQITSIICNPTWTVPPTILREDVIPATSKDTNYLHTKKIKIYNKDNQIISLSNWDKTNARSYRYVQNSGSNNSLGILKIMFTNRFTVYLHDTNNRSLFNNNYRSLSSGCIRVENPIDLTTLLLNNNQEKWNKKIYLL